MIGQFYDIFAWANPRIYMFEEDERSTRINKDEMVTNGVNNKEFNERETDIESLIATLQRKLNLQSQNISFKSFDGRTRSDIGTMWLEQFEPYEAEWSEIVALSMYKTPLADLARLWFQGAIGNEIKDKISFKREFRERFCPKQKEGVNELFKILHRGYIPEKFQEFVFLIRAVHKNAKKITLEEIISAIKEQSKSWIRKELDCVSRWSELLKVAEKIELIAKERKENIDYKSKAQNERYKLSDKPTGKSPKNVRCYECNGPYYKNKCPNVTREFKQKNKYQNKNFSLNLKPQLINERKDCRPFITFKTPAGYVNALIDTGATVSVMSTLFAKKCNFRINWKDEM